VPSPRCSVLSPIRGVSISFRLAVAILKIWKSSLSGSRRGHQNDLVSEALELGEAAAL
jgi:hypothetical protein